MKVGLYDVDGQVKVVDREVPLCPAGGLLVRSVACGLCSGELMGWYMDRKAPHVLGHEVAGIVVESEDARFPVGVLVSPHHHAPCGVCDLCRRGAFVHCPTWKRTRLDPGGMADYFSVSAENLHDCRLAEGLSARDAALMEPLACVVKSRRRGQWSAGCPTLVIGAGALGLMHAFVMPGAEILDISADRWANAVSLGLPLGSHEKRYERIFVLPGSASAFQLAAEVAAPDAVITLFAPLPPAVPMPLEMAEAGYFKDLTLVHSYSCGPNDTEEAMAILRSGQVRGQDLVSDFIPLADLPERYKRMRSGEILKAMVVWED